MTRLFIDFEASSLLPGGFPIEVALVDQDGQGESYLIRPEDDWTEWSPESEAVHGIPLAVLHAQGAPCRVVAGCLRRALVRKDVTVYSDAPGFDGGWLFALLEAGGVDARIALVDVELAYGQACQPMLATLPAAGAPGRRRAEQAVREAAGRIVTAARDREAMRARVRHRALPDAQGLWKTWRGVQRGVEEWMEQQSR